MGRRFERLSLCFRELCAILCEGFQLHITRQGLQGGQRNAGIRETSETSFLDWALQNTTLMVYQTMLARKILFNKRRQATGVLCSSEGFVENFTFSARKDIILSAGTFRSPQLLTPSGIGPIKTLSQYGIRHIADSPAVGQNVWDQLFAGPSCHLDATTASSLSNASALHEAEQQFIQNQTGSLSNTGGDFIAFEELPATVQDSLSNSTQQALQSFQSDWPEIEYLAL